MAGKWVMCCDCGDAGCSAAMLDGGYELGRFSGGGPFKTYDPAEEPPEQPCVDACVVGFFQAKFADAALAELLVGAGNYVVHPTSFSDPLSGVLTEPIPWVLFHDGAGTFARDLSRPCAVEVDTATIDFVGPTTAVRQWFVPMEVRLNGLYTWTRKAATPAWDGDGWGDFEEWRLTTPADPPLGGEPEDSQPRCVGFQFGVSRTGYVWPEAVGPPPGLRLQFKSDVAEATTPDPRNCCDAANFEVCIPRVISGLNPDPIMDGWGFGARYYGQSDWQTCEARDGTESDFDLRATVHVILNSSMDFTADGNGDCPPRGTVNLTGPAPDHYTCWRLPCAAGADLFALPRAADWQTYDCGPVAGVAHNLCGVELITFDTEACEDPGPPPACPDDWCRYVWDVATQTWESAGDMNCTCPPTWGAPAPGPDEPQIMYVCCSGTGGDPGGDPGPPSNCPHIDRWCRYKWNGSTWVLDASQGCTNCPLLPADTTPPGPGQHWYRYECCVL